MSIIVTTAYILMISQIILYIFQAFGFLFKPLNKFQKTLNQKFVHSWYYEQIRIGVLILTSILAVLFFETFTVWKWDKQLIMQHLDQTSLDALEDKEDMYRNERNMYIFGAAFFLSCANARYMIRLNHYYQLSDQVQKLTDGI